MSVQRWDVKHERVDRTGEFVLYEDYQDLERELTSYQIAKDNLELRLASVHEDGPCQDCMAAISRANEDYPTWQVY